MKIIERTYNIETGETVDIEREETAEETKARLDDQKAVQARIDESAQQESKRAAILDRLGLTEDELKTILG